MMPTSVIGIFPIVGDLELRVWPTHECYFHDQKFGWIFPDPPAVHSEIQPLPFIRDGSVHRSWISYESLRVDSSCTSASEVVQDKVGDPWRKFVLYELIEHNLPSAICANMGLVGLHDFLDVLVPWSVQ